MCGIVGFLTPAKNGFSMKETAFLNDMLYMDALRGWDATGIMYGVADGSVQVFKEASPAPLFLTRKEWEKASNEITSKGRWAVGHNRAATRGEKTDQNAHPFVVDNKIILLQNGTYSGSHHHLTKEHYAVDSHACAKVISDSPTVLEALNKIDAAYAFVWWNHEEGTLNVIRNSERPLYIGYTTNGGIAFASEDGIMIAAANRNDIKFREPPYLLKEHMLCTYRFGEDIDETYENLDVKVEKRFFQTPTTTHTMGWRSGQPTTIASNVQTVIDGFKSIDPQGLYNQSRLKQEDFNLYLVNAQLHAKQKTTFMVEAFDYSPVKPTDYSCDQWYVYGFIDEALEDSSMNGRVVSWTIQAEQAAEVVEYITNNMFKVTVKHLNASKNNLGVWTCVLQAEEVTPFEIVKDVVH